MSNKKQKLNPYVELHPKLINGFRNYGKPSGEAKNKIPDLAILAVKFHGEGWVHEFPSNDIDLMIRVLIRSHLRVVVGHTSATLDVYWQRFQDQAILYLEKSKYKAVRKLDSKSLLEELG